ncbi:DUF1254 domain-containing protein [Legionella lytica]|uniref:DUF1254 domain-containing protein n=1 Tax=Legionella lytica TaxID=96232 RepID=A0ABW8DAZ7_9GAMM
MSNKKCVAFISMLYCFICPHTNAQTLTVKPWETASEVPGVPKGTIMTPAYSKALARNIYIWGWPLVNSYNRRTMFAKAPAPGLNGGILPVAPVGYVSMLTDYISPAQRWVAHPNQDVVYGFGFGAVNDEPVVLQIPDFGDRFWVYAIYDARTNEFSKLGKQYGTKPGNYLIVGPNWKGNIPKDIKGVIYAPTELVAIGPRVFMNDSAEDRAAIQSVINQIVIYPLSKYTGKSQTVDWKNAPIFKTQGNTEGETQWVDPASFFNQLPGILDKVPPLPGEEGLYAQMKALLAAASSNPEIAQLIQQVAINTEKEIISEFFNFRTNGVNLPGGWTSPPNVARWGYDYATRTATAKSNMYVNQPAETRYFFAEVDNKGQRLNGNSNYTLTFPKFQTPPANGFWSLTMYNSLHFFEKNNLHRYSLGTKNLKNMKYNNDGSLTIYIQNASPGKEKESNWLPAPQGKFEMTIRTYWPKEEVNEGHWSPPPVIRMN